MVDLNIDFDKAAKISNSFNELSTECTSIASSCKGLDGSKFSFSPNAAAYCSKIQSGVSKISTQISNLQTSFNGSIDLYREVYEKQKTSVETTLSSGSPLDVGKTIVVDDLTASELSATVDFYFNYPSAVKNIKQVSETKLRNLFTANGATKVGADTYSFTIDGKKIKYNVSTHEVSVEGCKEPSL